MYRSVEVIEVRAWNDTVGALAFDRKFGCYVFEFDSKWISRGIDLAPIMMPPTRTAYVFPSLPAQTFKGLPGMLADALPDDFGNALIDAYLARQGVAKGGITSLDRLAYMAKRGMGALEFKPARGPRPHKPTAVVVSELVTSSRRALRGSFDGDAEAQAAILNLIQVGTSAGGARAKAVIAWHPATQQIRSGQLPAAEGFEHWLLKLDGIGQDNELGTRGHYGRIEYAYHLMARAAGITMAPCRLLEENGRAHFMTQRWDRRANEKVHSQTLCALMHLDYRQRGTHDYAQYFQAIDALKLPSKARAEAFRRMVFNVQAANCDDHTKNFSFTLTPGQSWELAPAYDITHAYNPKGEWTYQHLMSVNGKFRHITSSDIRIVADRFEVPDRKQIMAQVGEALARWPDFAKRADLPNTVRDRVQADFP